jgi:hypothetical protein
MCNWQKALKPLKLDPMQPRCTNVLRPILKGLTFLSKASHQPVTSRRRAPLRPHL